MKCFFKIGMVLAFLLAVSATGQAQTFAEWFQQKKTQISYLYKQIAALEAYIQVTEKGYQLAQQGTQLIGDTKKADFDLHSDYLSSLLTVNADIRQYPKVSALLDLQAQILDLSDQARQLAGRMPTWGPTITSFFDGLVQKGVEDLAQLQSITTDGAAQMTDDQRIKVIDRLYGREQKRWREAIEARNDIVLMILNY